MLMPKKVKHRKQQTRRLSGTASQKTQLSFGSYGLKATTNSWITSRQIEAARRAVTRFVKRGGKVWIRIFPDKAVTLKGAEVPMGGGKGAVDHYVAPVKKGTIMFEIEGVTEAIAREAFRLAGHKLPVKTKFISEN